jgi:hypothetical protein
MLRIGPTIATIALHVKTMMEAKEREAYRPSRCPTCKLNGLWCHGTYEREAGRGLGKLDPVEVPRYLCGRKGGCGGSCSTLPSCLPPRHWYLWSIQQAVLVLLLAGVSLHRCADIVGAIWGPSRSTARRWRGWLSKQHLLFSHHLLTAHCEWGRAPNWEAFWRKALECERLAALMQSLDRADVAVP